VVGGASGQVLDLELVKAFSPLAPLGRIALGQRTLVRLVDACL
jgi:hypothetical protein